jgi:hypothetical protein
MVPLEHKLLINTNKKVNEIFRKANLFFDERIFFHLLLFLVYTFFGFADVINAFLQSVQLDCSLLSYRRATMLPAFTFSARQVWVP